MKLDKAIFVVTFDDVVVHSSYILYKFLCNNFVFFSRYLNIFKLKTKKEIYERDEKDLIKYLMSKSILENKEAYSQDLMFSTLYINILNDFYKRKNIYDPREITPLMKNGLLNPIFSENSGIKEINFIVKYRTNEEKEDKINLLRSLFHDNQKIKIIPIHYKTDYFDEVKKINWDVIITDDVDLIEKTAAGNIDHKEYILAQYGYNKPKPELVELIKQKYANLSCYKIK